jgi:hypothetical protein
MKALGDYLHSKGFKFGIHNCAGTKTCAGFPGGRGHEYQDALKYASWGVDFLKYDWCNHGTADARETYKTMRDALTCGRPADRVQPVRMGPEQAVGMGQGRGPSLAHHGRHHGRLRQPAALGKRMEADPRPAVLAGHQ